MEKTYWWKRAIIYQIYPFSFMDSNNDGWGDIDGIISKLDHIKELGATAIWFSPLYVSPCKDMGYDIADYYNIDPKFGTMDDFKRLVSECKTRGLRIIMDMVLNHTSSEHEWFKKAISGDEKYKNYYIFRKGRKRGNKIIPPTNYMSSFSGSAWERVEGTDEYYLRIFSKYQPDLNWNNKEVRIEASKILNYWMDLGVSGFRLDVFNLFSKKEPLKNDMRLFSIPRGGNYFIDGPRMHEFLKELNENSFSKYDSYTVGESYMPHEKDALKYIDPNEKELDSIFDFSMFKSDSLFGLGILKKKFNIMEFKKGLFEPQKKYSTNTLVLENHDNTRSINRFGLNSYRYHYAVSTMLPTLVFLGKGIPFIYQGEESGIIKPNLKTIDDCHDTASIDEYNLMRKLGLSERKAMEFINYGARDNARVPLAWDDSINGGFNKGEKPWYFINPNYKNNNIKNDKESPYSVYKYYQKLLKLRSLNNTFIDGDTKEVNKKDKNVIAYLREGEKTYLIVANFKAKHIRYKLPKNLIGKKLSVVLTNYKEVGKEKGIILAPYQAVVFEVK